MFKRTRTPSPKWQRALCREDHSFTDWCLNEAVKMGTWCGAGLHREFVDGRVAGYWKILPCRCVAIIAVSGDHS